MNFFKAELIKSRSSYLSYLIVFCMFIYPIVAAIYFGIKAESIDSYKMVSYFYGSISLGQPIVGILFISYYYDLEQRCGNFKNLLIVGCRAEKQLIQLIFWLSLIYLFGLFFSYTIFKFILIYFFKINLYGLFLIYRLCLIFFIVFILQLILSTIVIYCEGVITGFTFAIIQVLLEMISLTSLLDRIEFLLPFVWPTKFAKFYPYCLDISLQMVFVLFVYLIASLTIIHCFFKKWN